MRIFLIALLVLTLTACSQPYDKYVGYWLLESDRSDVILEIRKEDKDTYLLNQNIFRKTDFLGNAKKETVLAKTDKEELGVNNGLMIIPMNISSGGEVLRILDKKYTKMSEKTAKTMIENINACDELKTKFYEEKKTLGGFIFGDHPNKAKLEELKSQYGELQKKIPNCKFDI